MSKRWIEIDGEKLISLIYSSKLCTHCFKFVNVKPKSCFDLIWKLWSALLLKPTWNWLNFDLCNNNLVSAGMYFQSPFDVWRIKIQNMLDPSEAIAELRRTQLEIEIKHTSWQSGSWDVTSSGTIIYHDSCSLLSKGEGEPKVFSLNKCGEE